MAHRFLAPALFLAALVFIAAIDRFHRRAPGIPPSGPFTLAERLQQIGPAARERLAPSFQAAGVNYPPSDLTIVAFKRENRLVVYANRLEGDPALVADYPILATSGQLGPKLREGDRQIPEGIYQLQTLNPNSRYHVSIRVNYPNAFDRAQAARDDRSTPGTDIFIHGSDRSIGCLAVGDQAAEDLFVLAHDTGLDRGELVIAPYDPRSPEPPPSIDAPEWMEPVYEQLIERIRALPEPRVPGR